MWRMVIAVEIIAVVIIVAMVVVSSELEPGRPSHSFTTNNPELPLPQVQEGSMRMLEKADQKQGSAVFKERSVLVI
jgi:hypothetical protein